MPRSKSLRLVIDTNIWISFLISDRFRKLDYILKVQNVQIVFSEELLNEIRKTILKPKLKKYFSVNALEEMLLNLDSYIDLVTVKTKTNICRDPNDNFLLALSKDGKANFLITGDKDLLDLVKFGRTQIIDISSFLNELKQYR